MNIREFAVSMAVYNRWVNEQIFAAAAARSDEERRRELGGAFGSVHATLLHLLVADRVWLQRFRGQPLTAVEGQEAFAAFDALHRARVETDDDLDRWAASLDEDFGARPFRFDSLAYNRSRTVPGWSAVVHLFNHQTHHRGQVMTLLRQLGDAPAFTADLVWMPQFD